MAKHVIGLAMFAGIFGKGIQFSPAVDYDDVGAHDPTIINAPGTELDIFYARREDFTVLQDVDTAATIEEWGEILDQHTFDPPKGFFKLRVVMDENWVKMESQGDKTGGGWHNSARFFVKGNARTLRGIAAQLNNDDCIFLIPMKDGLIAQIGSKHCIAYCKTNFDAKTDKASDPRGWEFMVECYDKYPTIYSNSLDIPLHE